MSSEENKRDPELGNDATPEEEAAERLEAPEEDPGATAEGDAYGQQRIREPQGASGPGRCHVGQALGENATLTGLIGTKKLAYSHL